MFSASEQCSDSADDDPHHQENQQHEHEDKRASNVGMFRCEPSESDSENIFADAQGDVG